MRAFTTLLLSTSSPFIPGPLYTASVVFFDGESSVSSDALVFLDDASSETAVRTAVLAAVDSAAEMLALPDAPTDVFLGASKIR